LAEVLDVGPAVTAVRRGDLVVPTVRRPCPHAKCQPCRVDRQDFCVTGDFRERGIKRIHGFLQELVVEDELNLIRVPRSLGEVAVLIEPLSIGAKAAEQGYAIQDRLPWERARQRAVVLGAGPVGLLGAMAMVVDHFDTYVYSLEPATSDRAALVRSMGATYLSGEDLSLQALPEQIGPIDVIYEAVGVSGLAFSALELLGANGVFVFTGVPALKEPRSIDTDRLMRNIVLRNQAIFGTVNASRSSFELALRGLEQAMFLFPDTVRGLISHRSAIDEVPRIMTLRGGIKEVIRLRTPSETEA
jgi:threonine dehydrogenase-like Zn-dependent dehydrogenase